MFVDRRGEQQSVDSWIVSLINRFNVQVKKYKNERRDMVIPIRFTGSTDDLRFIAAVKNKHPRTVGDVKFSTREFIVRLRTDDLQTFTDDELNEWCRIFHEYWLTLVKSIDAFKQRAENSFVTWATSDPPASKSFLAQTNSSYLGLSIELLLEIFEKDIYMGPRNVGNFSSDTNVNRTSYDVVSVISRLSDVNRYLAKRILERPELVKN